MVDMIAPQEEKVHPVNISSTITRPSSFNLRNETPCTETTFPIISEDTPVILDHNYTVQRTNELDFGLNSIENNPIILNIETTTPHIVHYDKEDLNDILGLNETSLPLPSNDTSIEVDFEIDYFNDVTFIENLNLSYSDQLKENSHPTTTTTSNAANEVLDVICGNTGNEKNVDNVDDEEQLSDDSNKIKEIGPIEENAGLETGPDNVDDEEQLFDNIDQNTLNQDEPVDLELDGQQRSIKRKKRHQVNPSTWDVNKWKENRKLGKEYMGGKKQN